MKSFPKGSLGGADLNELAKISAQAFQVTPGDDIAPFDIDWHETFDRWGAGADAVLQGSLVLLFSDTAQVVGASIGCETVFQFGVMDTVEPGVYLVSRSASGNAWRIPDSSADHQANCQKIVSHGLGANVAVVMGIKSGHFLVLPSGIVGTSWSVNLNYNSSTLDDEIITSHLTAFAVENLNSSDSRGDIWEDSTKWIPKEQAERIIQKQLVIGLRTAFINHSILSEPPTSIGRLDLLIVSKSPTNPDKVVLELKAVRGLTSTGSTVHPSSMVTHLEEGVQQADQYRKKVGGTAAYLCVYDLRKSKGGPVIETAKPKCDAADVKLRVFDVHNSSKAARKSAAKVAAGSVTS